MKYTRIDVKNKKRSSGNNNNNNNDGKNFILLFVGVIVVALVISTIMSKFIWPEGKKTASKEQIETTTTEGEKKPGENNGNPGGEEKPKDNKVVSEGTEGQEYVMVQCGFYSNKENANSVKADLKEDYIAVSLSEAENYRVIVHIGNEEEATKLSNELTEKGVSNTKGRFLIPKADTCSNEIIEIVNGYVNIINKLKEDSVKGVKTTEFKEWVNGLEEDSKSEYFPIFKELKTGINEIPDEITKENIEGSYQIIFDTLNKFKVNK
ncbi:SPOR domain-containing protein [Clostridium sp. LIBA-8841]|uniref:SPOR domain-containing protein n=1 Tax=Clostridium sp. LIBA-8841 TaxID=2987530 RepID=UPI002AC50365|nr:SPOR domain-containing protein [Clostridium sp. LIBA-8841]MDZ5253096.1 SPOR domain-containing protein [Clostridium sp. LIBA-8841]